MSRFFSFLFKQPRVGIGRVPLKSRDPGTIPDDELLCKDIYMKITAKNIIEEVFSVILEKKSQDVFSTKDENIILVYSGFDDSMREDRVEYIHWKNSLLDKASSQGKKSFLVTCTTNLKLFRNKLLDEFS